MNIKDCIPRDKFDTAAIERARRIGFPRLNPILPDLLSWVQDGNWPVAPLAASLLSEADTELLPPIKAVLSSKDSVWKYWTLTLVLRNANSDVFVGLRDDLERLASHPTPDDQAEGVQVVARRLLSERAH